MAEEKTLDIRWNAGVLEVFVGDACVIRHTPAQPFVMVGHGNPTFRASHGSYRIRSRLRWKKGLSRATVESQDETGAVVVLSGDGGIAARLELWPSQEGAPLLSARVAPVPGAGPAWNRVWLRLPAGRREPTYGCGQQYSRFNLRGSRLPLWSGEQGVGRAFNVTTLAANIHSGSGGSWHSTYFPQPSYVTEAGRLVHLETDAYARFVFGPDADRLEVWQPEVSFVLGRARDLEGAVRLMSDQLGRQPRLPEWTHNGMWLGLQGGSDVVREKVARARAAGLPLGAVWVQDWVGRRVTAFGSQLFWDWKYNRERYPDLPELIRELRDQNVRFLGYINPFLAIEGELYKEASARGYCIKKSDGSDYLITVTTFPAAKVDLSNPDAWSWFKRVIQENMLGIGLSGWMADYGEYLPTDAVLAAADPERFHNRYPAEWARLNYEAVKEAGKLEDTVIFMRAGYTGSSRYAHSIWAGDQMVDWSRHDGLPSVMPAALSAGMVGIGVAHSDIGGFTSLYSRKRSRELLLRWAEHAAFTPIMRSHESNRPADNWQWDGDEVTTSHMVRMARIYVGLKPYRQAFLEEYYAQGLPAMRPVALHYDGRASRAERTAVHNPYRYLLGRDLLVQPVVRRGVASARVFLPKDEWVHLWTGSRTSGGPVTVPAPIGLPPVFYRAASPHVEVFESLRESGSLKNQ
jgi:alpha-glucosidase